VGIESVPNRARHPADILFYGFPHLFLSYFQDVLGVLATLRRRRGG
jgi:hypothetical protein